MELVLQCCSRIATAQKIKNALGNSFTDSESAILTQTKNTFCLSPWTSWSCGSFVFRCLVVFSVAPAIERRLIERARAQEVFAEEALANSMRHSQTMVLIAFQSQFFHRPVFLFFCWVAICFTGRTDIFAGSQFSTRISSHAPSKQLAGCF